MSLSSFSSGASESSSKRRRISRKPTGTSLDYGQRAAHVDIAFRDDPRLPYLNAERGRHGLECHAGTGDQRLQKHVLGTRERPIAAGGRMKPRLDRPAGRLNGKGKIGRGTPRRPQRQQRSVRIVAVLLLERRLHRFELFFVHDSSWYGHSRAPGWIRRGGPMVRRRQKGLAGVAPDGITAAVKTVFAGEQAPWRLSGRVKRLSNGSVRWATRRPSRVRLGSGFVCRTSWACPPRIFASSPRTSAKTTLWPESCGRRAFTMRGSWPPWSTIRRKVTLHQMEQWAADFDSWAVCDAACCCLFDKTPHAWNKAVEWIGREPEYVKRAGLS